MKRQPTDINAVIEEMREVILADARVHGARVGFELGPRLPRVAIDAAQIQHVILVRNGLEALNAAEPSGRILHVRTEQTEDGDKSCRALCWRNVSIAYKALDSTFARAAVARFGDSASDM